MFPSQFVGCHRDFRRVESTTLSSPWHSSDGFPDAMFLEMRHRIVSWSDIYIYIFGRDGNCMTETNTSQQATHSSNEGFLGEGLLLPGELTASTLDCETGKMGTSHEFQNIFRNGFSSIFGCCCCCGNTSKQALSEWCVCACIRSGIVISLYAVFTFTAGASNGTGSARKGGENRRREKKTHESGWATGKCTIRAIRGNAIIRGRRRRQHRLRSLCSQQQMDVCSRSNIVPCHLFDVNVQTMFAAWRCAYPPHTHTHPRPFTRPLISATGNDECDECAVRLCICQARTRDQ